MARNVIHEARADAAQVHDDCQLVSRMREHAGSPMYLGELVAALGPSRWAAVVQHGHPGDLAGKATDAAREIASAEADAAGSHNHGAHVVHLESHRPHSLYLERYVYWLYNHGQLHELDNIPSELRQILGTSAGQAELDGIVPASAVTGAVRPTTTGTDPLESAATATVTQPVADARRKLTAAEHALAALDDELQLQLREIAPAVWDPHEHDWAKQDLARQRVAAYIKDFRASPRYKHAQDQVRRWGGVVKSDLAASEDLLLAHGHAAGAPADARHASDTLLGLYEALALSQTQAQDAALWALAHEHDSRLSKADLVRVGHIRDTAMATDGYYKSQQLTDIVRSAADHKAGIFNAIAFVRQHVIAPYQRFQQVRGLLELGHKLDEIKAHWEIWRAPNPQVAQQLAADFIRATGQGSPIVSKVGTSFGVLMGLGDKSTALAQVDNPLAFSDSVKGLYDEIKSFKQLIGKGVKSPSEEERAAALAKQIHGRYVLLGKSFALIGIAGGALGIKDDLASIDKYGNDPATDVKLVGDVATALGSALTMTPLWPIGEALNLIGSTISLMPARSRPITSATRGAATSATGCGTSTRSARIAGATTSPRRSPTTTRRATSRTRSASASRPTRSTGSARASRSCSAMPG